MATPFIKGVIPFLDKGRAGDGFVYTQWGDLFTHNYITNFKKENNIFCHKKTFQSYNTLKDRKLMSGNRLERLEID